MVRTFRSLFGFLGKVARSRAHSQKKITRRAMDTSSSAKTKESDNVSDNKLSSLAAVSVAAPPAIVETGSSSKTATATSENLEAKIESWKSSVSKTLRLNSIVNKTKRLRRRQEIEALEKRVAKSEKVKEMKHAETERSVDSMIEAITARMAMDCRLEEKEKAKKRKRRRPRRTLTEEETRRVEDSFGGRDADLVADKFKIELTREKFRCLRDSTWLNDDVILFFLEIIKENCNARAAKDESLPKVHVFNTFFVSKLLEERGGYNFRNVRRWTRKVKIFEMDVVIVPVNQGNTHWTMAAIFPKKREIRFYDSMGSKGRRYLNGLKRYIIDEWADKQERHKLDSSTKPDPEAWRLISTGTSVPQQHNGVDCGVFVCAFAECLACGYDLDFSQSDMPFFRRHIGLSILSNGTLVPAPPE